MDFPGKNTGVGCHFLLQGIFPNQGSNPSLLHCRQILYHLSHQGIPKVKFKEIPRVLSDAFQRLSHWAVLEWRCFIDKKQGRAFLRVNNWSQHFSTKLHEHYFAGDVNRCSKIKGSLAKRIRETVGKRDRLLQCKPSQTLKYANENNQSPRRTFQVY